MINQDVKWGENVVKNTLENVFSKNKVYVKSIVKVIVKILH